MDSVRSRMIRILFFGFGYMILMILILVLFDTLNPGILFFIFGLFATGLVMKFYMSRIQKPDRFTLKGAGQSDNLLRLIIVAVLVYVIYIVILNFYSPRESVIVSVLSVGGLVLFVDRSFGKEMQEYVDETRENHNEFVQSIMDKSRKCQSCRVELGEVDVVCHQCGFKQRPLDDSSYLSKL